MTTRPTSTKPRTPGAEQDGLSSTYSSTFPQQGESERTVAALFVDPRGAYVGLDGVQAWDEFLDARLYSGPHPVVAHPPCERWGRYWGGGPSAKTPRLLGDDNGCFASALASVRRYGGVLEHPEASHAWRTFDLAPPPRRGGWVRADFIGGWTCCVEQGHYGHRARKATWLYAFGVELPVLKWGPARGCVRMDAGYHSAEERAAAGRRPVVGRLKQSELAATPVEFRDALLSIARTVSL